MTPDELKALAERARAERDARQNQPIDLNALAQQARREKDKRRQEQGWLHRLGDNIIGFDDGYQSPGEHVGQFVNRAVESATLGIVGDEANAWVDSRLGRMGDGTSEIPTYEEALARRRSDEEQFQNDHPVAAVGADLAGAFLPGLGGANLALKGATLGSKVALGAGLGGAGGGVMGFTEGEENASTRFGNAAGGAVVGGALGGAIPVAGATARGVYNRFGPGAAAEVRATRRALDLDRTGTEIVADSVRRDQPYAAARLAEAGPNAVNAEMGTATQQLLDHAANVSNASASQVRNGVEEIAANRAGQFADVLDRTTGRAMGANRRVGDLMQSSARAREDAYQAAYDSVIDYNTPQGHILHALLDRVDPSAINKANRTLRADGQIDSIIRRTVDDTGDAAFDQLPDVQALDYITRSLNDMADPLAGAGKNESGAFRKLAQEIRGAMEQVSPEFANARALGGSVVENREAIEFGAELLAKRIPVDQAEDMISAMSPAELQFAQYGFRDGIEAMMENAQRALTDSNMDAREVLAPIRAILSGGGERKVRSLFGKQADEIIKAAKEAYSALSMRAAMAQNSKTQIRDALNDRLETAVPMGAGEALMSGRGVSGSVATAARNVAGDPALARQNAKDSVMERVGRALLARTDDPSMGQSRMSQIPAQLDARNRVGDRIQNRSTQALAILNALIAQEQARTGAPINRSIQALQGR